jgi:transcriptional regulator with XRE-family HTH domain
MQDAIYQRVKKARKHLGLTQEEVAEGTEIKRSSISKIENGSLEVPNSLLLFFTGTHHVPAEWLLNGKGVWPSENKEASYSASNQTNTTNQQGTNNQSGGASETLRIAQLEIEGLKREIARQEKYIKRLEKQLGIEEETE